MVKNRRTKDGELREVTITIDFLVELWHQQKGSCPYTGISLVLPYVVPKTQVHGWTDDTPPHKRPSLDRIDSSKGYIPGNIQFVSQMANYAKNTASHDEMVRFCQAIAEHWKSA